MRIGRLTVDGVFCLLVLGVDVMDALCDGLRREVSEFE